MKKKTIGGEHAAAYTNVELHCPAPGRERDGEEWRLKAREKWPEHKYIFLFYFLHFLKYSNNEVGKGKTIDNRMKIKLD